MLLKSKKRSIGNNIDGKKRLSKIYEKNEAIEVNNKSIIEIQPNLEMKFDCGVNNEGTIATNGIINNAFEDLEETKF